jgi:hypothetical protein
MAKKTSPDKKTPSKLAAAKQATKSPAKKPAAKSPKQASAAKSAHTPAKKTPAKRKSKEPAVLTAKSTKPKADRSKPARRSKAAPKAETYLAKVSHWPQDVIAGLGRMFQKAAPAKDAAKDVAAESLGWIKSRATQVKEVGAKELHELVRVASKLKELRSTPAPATGKRKAKHK